MPHDDGSRSALLQTLLASFCKEFVGGLVEKRADVKTGRPNPSPDPDPDPDPKPNPNPNPNQVKTGRRIKDAFGELQASLREVRPFEGSAFEDAYLLEAVRTWLG